ncbi:hypothetical protein CCZ01_03640 [Helicobacter monodelphidis]|uniref:class I SAM-dependent methyltransferase n=1 Tax=Helicobacter sp. 15-1451 TaxID=2004995 RepID=UPI000DCCBCAC|nr:class I SAM-dependent methyltransferase [Helicobacter sp. 15-1451]RAX58177.1 hypothetical protein CCZ01_03640 [Helicobacter sp. 15-1451]
MLDIVHLHDIAELYSKRAKQFGYTHKAVFWQNQDEQIQRFTHLLSLLNLQSHSTLNINDFGCGYGALYSFLEKSGFQIRLYNGYDISKNMLKEAKKFLHAYWWNKKIRLYFANSALYMADYTFVSGTFNLCHHHPKQIWEEYIFFTLRNLFQQSNKAVVFNLLSIHKQPQYEGLYYANISPILDFCQKLGYIKNYYDTHLCEWSIAIFKDKY